jgi:hypothetical protein
MTLSVHLFAAVNQPLLRRWNTLLLFNFFLDLGYLLDDVSNVKGRSTTLEPPHDVVEEETWDEMVPYNRSRCPTRSLSP